MTLIASAIAVGSTLVGWALGLGLYALIDRAGGH